MEVGPRSSCSVYVLLGKDKLTGHKADKGQNQNISLISKTQGAQGTHEETLESKAHMEHDEKANKEGKTQMHTHKIGEVDKTGVRPIKVMEQKKQREEV